MLKKKGRTIAHKIIGNTLVKSDLLTRFSHKLCSEKSELRTVVIKRNAGLRLKKLRRPKNV